MVRIIMMIFVNCRSTSSFIANNTYCKTSKIVRLSDNGFGSDAMTKTKKGGGITPFSLMLN